jgi:hypothetical protein
MTMTQWQPRYDPDEHARRLDQGTAPQGHGQPRQQPPPQWPPQPQPPYQPQYQQPQPGWQQPPPQFPPPGPGHRQPPRKRKGGLAAFLIGGTAAVIVVIVIAAAANSGKTPAPSASSPAAPPASASAPSSPAAAAAAAQTVTYSVTGSPADVTYGPAGSDLSGHVPLHKTVKLGNPSYYAISAQLQGGGTVKCEISVNGKVVSKATATGGYNLAQCEIVQDPFSGGWQDANSA